MLSDPDGLLTRAQIVEELVAAGFPTTISTLSNLAVTGGGPEYLKFGMRVLYRRATAMAWAQNKLMTPRAPRRRAA